MVDTGPGEAPSRPDGLLPAGSVPAFRPGQSDLAARCAGQHEHVDSGRSLSSLASLQLSRLFGDFDAALVLSWSTGNRAIRGSGSVIDTHPFRGAAGRRS